MEEGLYKVVPNFLLSDEYPELVLIPTLHNVEVTNLECIPFILLNLSERKDFLKKRGNTQTFRKGGHYCRGNHYWNHVSEFKHGSWRIQLCCLIRRKAFITSPTDVDTHRKVKLQDAEVLDHYKEEFEELCEEYKDIFSNDSSDIGKTPLITMEIETEDSPPSLSKTL